MNKRLIYIALAVVMLLSGCGAKTSKTDEGENQTPIETVTLSKGTIRNEYVFTGEISASEQVNVTSKIPGKAVSVNYSVGDEVSAGSVLFVIDTSDILNGINVLRSQLATADAGINSARVSADLANGSAMQMQIASSKAQLDQLEISLNSAKKTYNDNKVLYDSGFISRQAFEQIENAYNQALISYNSAKQNYDTLVNKTSSENEKRANTALEQAIAAKNSILAQIASQESSLRDAAVSSPISGIVTTANVKAGEMVSAAMPPFTVSKIDVVTIDIAVTEQTINSISVGQKVGIEITSVSNEKIEGVITTVNPAADAATGTYKVRISIDNKDNLLKPGMFGKVRIVREESENALLLPRNAVIGMGSEQYVFISENGVAKKTAVTTGIDNGQEIEIKTGLTEGQSVVIKGQTYLKDGDAVNSVSADTKGE